MPYYRITFTDLTTLTGVFRNPQGIINSAIRYDMHNQEAPIIEKLEECIEGEWLPLSDPKIGREAIYINIFMPGLNKKCKLISRAATSWGKKQYLVEFEDKTKHLIDLQDLKLKRIKRK